MVTVLGNASRAITGGAGLDVPLEPPVLSAQQSEARRQRQIAAIEAAETAAARVAEKQPRLRRRRRNDALSVPASVPRPTPAPEPQVLTEPALPVEPVTVRLPEAESETTPEPEAMPGFEIDAPTQVRQLRAELAMAGQRIRALLAQVDEQSACIAGAVADMQIAASLSAQLSELATDQQGLLRARAESTERDLAAAHRQIEALIVELVTAHAPVAPPVDDRQVEPVLCLGTGCGLPVAPEFVSRTGYLWHSPCQDKVPTAARFPGRRVA